LLSRKARPGTIDYAVPQLGAPPHVFGLMFAHDAEIEMVAIPHRSAPEAVASVIRGDIPFLIDAPFHPRAAYKGKFLESHCGHWAGA
jgi:tripartite-type tricarboxylate transporter receptor subunit TctC